MADFEVVISIKEAETEVSASFIRRFIDNYVYV